MTRTTPSITPSRRTASTLVVAVLSMALVAVGPTATTADAAATDTCLGLAPTLVATADGQTLTGTDGPDVVVVDGVRDVTVDTLRGDDTVCLDGVVTSTVRTGPGDDRAEAVDVTDVGVVGGPGDDDFTCRPTATDDVRLEWACDLLGGSGDDRLLSYGGGVSGGPGDDVLALVGGGVGIGGSDHDLVTFRGLRGPVRVDLGAERFSTPGGRGRLAAVEDVHGSRGDDVLIGDRAANRLVGGAGRDRAYGGPGHDSCQAERRYSC